MTGEWRPLTIEEAIDWYLGAGWTQEETVEELARHAWARESGERIYRTPPGRRRLAEIVAERAAPAKRDPNAGPIATAEQAEAAYREHGSDRLGAAALGVSRTQFRRLRGLEK